MTIASLLNPDEPAFVFEHAMAHRTFLGVMAPLPRFSAIPYFIDPMTVQAPADRWNLNHQQAHNDALVTLPSGYGSALVGLQVGGNLVDTDFSDPQVRAWWTHQNHVEHRTALETILPATPPPFLSPPPPPPPPTGGTFRRWQYPFG